MSKKLSICCFKTKQKKFCGNKKTVLISKELESFKKQLIQRIKDAKNLDELKLYTTSVNESKIYSYTSYHEIITKNNFDFLRCLENTHHKEKLPKSLNSNRENLLHLACKLNKPYFIKQLIELKCEVFKQDYMGRTPLHVAMVRGHHECIQEFLNVFEKHLNIQEEETHSGCNDELKENLIKMFRMYSHDGYTIIHAAVLKDLPNVLEVMLRFCRKYNINILSNEVLGNGDSLLHLAVKNRLYKVIEVIVRDVPESLKFRNYGGALAYDIDAMSKDIKALELTKNF